VFVLLAFVFSLVAVAFAYDAFLCHQN